MVQSGTLQVESWNATSPLDSIIVAHIPLMLDGSGIPPAAEIHVGVTLTAISNAWVVPVDQADASAEFAAFIFGSELGQCPQGGGRRSDPGQCLLSSTLE